MEQEFYGVSSGADMKKKQKIGPKKTGCCKEYKYCTIGTMFDDIDGCLHLVDETAYEKYKDYESFEKFNFCPNCGNEIKCA